MLRVATALGVCAVAGVAFAAQQSWGREQYPGQYAQVDPAIKKWFNEQKIPGTDESCCSAADGVYAEEDIRGGHYWTRFVAIQHNYGAPPIETDSGWVQVPDEVVIHDPNRHGAPVVWWWLSNGRPVVRCFAPGGGV